MTFQQDERDETLVSLTALAEHLAEKSSVGNMQNCENLNVLIEIIPNAVFVTEGPDGVVATNRLAKEVMSDNILAEINHMPEWCLTFTVPHNTAPSVDDQQIGISGKWYSVYRVPIISKSGASMGALICAKDISEKKRATVELARQDEEIKENEERFRVMVEAIPQMAWMARADGHHYWFNHRWYDYTGTNVENMEGWGWQMVHHPDYLEAVIRKWREHIAIGKEWEDTFPIRGADGSYRWFLSSAYPIRDQHGDITCWFGTHTDVTEIRNGREAMLDAAARIERQDMAKSMFLAAASHDLRQPLQAMEFFANTVSRHVSPEGQEMFGKMINSLSQLGRLLDNLLHVTRLDSELIQTHYEDFRIGDLLAQIGDAYSSQAAAKGITLHTIPSTVLVHSDRSLLSRMLIHLIENAIAYTERGRILIDVVPHEKTVSVEVRDSGVGIGQEHLDLIWDEFYQVGNQKRERRRGQGLGLAVVRRLAALLELPPVRVQSVVGEGTIFVIDLPRTKTDIVAEKEAAAIMEASRVPKSVIINNEGNCSQPQSKPIVLVVDDDAMLREAFEAIFETWEDSWDTVLAESTDVALEVVSNRRIPDFIVMDYRLGEETGDVAIQRIRTHFKKEIPAMILTGDVGDEVQTRAREINVPIMYKPIDTSALHDLISSKVSEPV